MNQKLNQLIISGHGSSNSIRVGENNNDPKIKSMGKLDTKNEAWCKFFSYLNGNMMEQKADKIQLKPIILLNACFVNSHIFFDKEMDALKQEKSKLENQSQKLMIEIAKLEKEKVNVKAIKQKELQVLEARRTNLFNGMLAKVTEKEKIEGDKARAVIKKQFIEEPNMVEYITSIVNKSIQVLGSHAALNSKNKLINPDGSLTLLTDKDEKYLIDKKQYISSGKEPAGVLSALIEEWAKIGDKKNVKTFLDVSLKFRTVSTINDVLINIFFDLINKKFRNDIIKASYCCESAEILQNITQGSRLRVKLIVEDPILRVYPNEILLNLIKSIDNKDRDFKKRVVLWQALCIIDKKYMSDFMKLLSAATIDKKVYPHFETSLLQAQLNTLFMDTYDLNGRLFLAIYFATKHKDEECKAFLMEKDKTIELQTLLTRLGLNKSIYGEDKICIEKTEECSVIMKNPVPFEEGMQIMIIGEVKTKETSSKIIRFPDYRMGYLNEGKKVEEKAKVKDKATTKIEEKIEVEGEEEEEKAEVKDTEAIEVEEKIEVVRKK